MMKKTALIMVGALMAQVATAQEGFKRTQTRMLDEAELLMQAEGYADAAKIYRRLLPIDTTFAEVSYNLGLCEWRLPGRWAQSAGHFAQAVRNGSVEAHYMLALCRHRQQRFEEALALFATYKHLEGRAVPDADVDRHAAMSSVARTLTRSPEDQVIINMGATVNSKAHDYCPLAVSYTHLSVAPIRLPCRCNCSRTSSHRSPHRPVAARPWSPTSPTQARVL